MFEDTEEDIIPLKPLIGKTVSHIELRDYCGMFADNVEGYIKGKGNITIVFTDGTAIQGVDGEYGDNNIVIKCGKEIQEE